MDTYGHLFEGSDRESAERMDRIFGAVKGDAKTGSNVVVIRGKNEAHADKNADKNAEDEISTPVSA